MNVKSLISHPADAQPLKAGPVAVAGVAWTGPGRVTTVEVSVNGGPWQPATLGGPDVEGSWRTWRFDWDAPAGSHAIRARATDSHGAHPARAIPLEQERLPLERDRDGRGRGCLTEALTGLARGHDAEPNPLAGLRPARPGARLLAGGRLPERRRRPGGA